MKKTLILLLLAPFALNAMDDDMQKCKPINICLTPSFGHARADKCQHTVWCMNYNSNNCTLSGSSQLWAAKPYKGLIGMQEHGKEVKILETIPNDDTQLFTVLYSLQNNQGATSYSGATIAKYGETIPLGDEENGVQYFLLIPKLGNQNINPFTKRPPVKTEDLSDDARTFLALFAQAPANTNNNNNQ